FDWDTRGIARQDKRSASAMESDELKALLEKDAAQKAKARKLEEDDRAARNRERSVSISVKVKKNGVVVRENQVSLRNKEDSKPEIERQAERSAAKSVAPRAPQAPTARP